MCGILGFTKYLATPHQIVMASVMLDEMVDRGRQSWGTTDGEEVCKFVEAATSGDWSKSHIMRPSASHLRTMFAHTRAASHGGITLENAHPHLLLSDDANHKIIGVHNGTIADWSMKANNLKNFQVDSQMIFDMLVNNQETKDVEGTGVLVYMQDHISLRMLRFNSTNLYVARDLSTGGLVWASTKDAVEKAAKRAGVLLSAEMPTKAETIYEVQDSPDGHIIVDVGEQKFAAPRTMVRYVNGADLFDDNESYNPWTGHGNRGASIPYHATCHHCQTFRPIVGGIGLCTICETIMMDPTATIYSDTMIYIGHYVMSVEETTDDDSVGNKLELDDSASTEAGPQQEQVTQAQAQSSVTAIDSVRNVNKHFPTFGHLVN